MLQCAQPAFPLPGRPCFSVESLRSQLDLEGPKIHRLKNLMTMEIRCNVLYSNLNIWFEPIDELDDTPVSISHFRSLLFQILSLVPSVVNRCSPLRMKANTMFSQLTGFSPTSQSNLPSPSQPIIRSISLILSTFNFALWPPKCSGSPVHTKSS